ncbi:MAG: phosphatase PAP2 family protein [bacterium]|nr:phosphatase PAP2 family protein [bacterium]
MILFILINFLTPALNFTKETLYDTKYIIASPLRWDIESWSTVMGVGITTYEIMLEDETVKSFVQSHRNDKVAKKCEYIGDGTVAATLVASSWIAGELTHNYKLQKMGDLGLKSILISGLIVNCTKRIAGRSRPYSSASSADWTGPTLSGEELSFPSGHTSTAFALASVVSELYDNKWIDFLAYGTAMLGGWARINDNQHWASDVFMGAVIGISVGKTLVKLEKSNKKSH